jgi:putative acetyltransferase
MTGGFPLPASAPRPVIRAGRLEDVSAVLHLIEGAIEHGCRGHYDATQRRAVYLGYATSLFADAVGSFELWIAEIDGQLAGVAQLDPSCGGLRGLYVGAALQGQGVGRVLLAAVEDRARAAGCARLGGAMSLNAVPFYAQAGFRPCAGPSRLLSAGVRVPITRMEKPLR